MFTDSNLIAFQKQLGTSNVEFVILKRLGYTTMEPEMRREFRDDFEHLGDPIAVGLTAVVGRDGCDDCFRSPMVFQTGRQPS